MRQRLGLYEVMALVAGVGVGLWLFLDSEVRQAPATSGGVVFWLVLALLGGLSLVGPPLLLAERRRRHPPWGAGKVLWFSQGMSAWLLWPPIIYRRIQGAPLGRTTSGICFAYGTPLMAIHITAALLAGGWLRRARRRRRARRSWRETFGLILALAWACTGLYVLYVIYREDFRR